jgi:tetratricopeptide (TPR) repeat protein
VLEDLLRRYAETVLEIPSNDEVIETLLSASKFGPLARRRLILSLVDQLLEKRTASVHLEAEAVYQRSVVLCLKGDITGSNKLLQEFLDRADIATRLQSHSILELLHLSQATNHAYNFDFLLANKEAKMWMPTESDGTEKQLDVVWSQIHSAGRILRGQGQFQTACLFFERSLQREPLRESKRHLALAHPVDTYIEVDFLQRCEIYSQSTGELLDRAEKLIRPEMENLRSRAPRSKGYRRLLLSLSEIEIRRSQFAAAEQLLMEVSSIYGKLIDPDIVDRLGHVRSLIAFARISPLSEAETRWNNALSLGRRYNPLEEEVFTVAFIHLFICVVRLQHGNLEDAEAAFNYAAGICRTKPLQFLIPGAGTFLFDNVQCQIELLSGWKLLRHEL